MDHKGGLWLSLAWTCLKNAHSRSSTNSTQAGLRKRQTDWRERPAVLSSGGDCIATKRHLCRLSISSGFGVALMRITGALTQITVDS